MNWIEIKEGCKLPERPLDVQIVVNGDVTCGYYLAGRDTYSLHSGWMEYTLKGTDDCKPSHWQHMASPPEAA